MRKVALIRIMGLSPLVFLLFPTEGFASCPACLGGTGFPLRGSFFYTNSPLSMDLRYLENRQKSGPYWRRLRLGRLSLAYSLGSYQLGTALPFDFVEGYMFDSKYHRVTGVPGVDLYARKSWAPFKAGRPVTVAFAGLRLPIGRVDHLDHPSASAPIGILGGLAYGISPGFSWVLYGDLSGVWNLPRNDEYSFGSKIGGDGGILYALPTSRLLLIGIDGRIEKTFPDDDPLEPEVKENTGYFSIKVGPRFQAEVSAFPKVLIDSSLRFKVFEELSGPQYLPSLLDFETGLSVGF